MPCLLAIDPGTEKCGFALVQFDGTLLKKGILPTKDLSGLLEVVRKHHPEFLVMGKGTNHGKVLAHIEKLGIGLVIKMGEEKNTTYEARKKYFHDHPPKGFWRFIPLSMQIPGEPIDDYAAWNIGEEYLKSHQLSAISHQEKENGQQPSGDGHQPSAISYQPSGTDQQSGKSGEGAGERTDSKPKEPDEPGDKK